MQDDRFEWDDVKAASNARKHRVSFDQACEAFDDPNAEDRWRLIGMTRSGLLYVIHTERGTRTRIISAMKGEPE